MELPAQRAAAEALERYLGDPADPRSRIPWARALELDEAEQFPEELLAVVRERGVQAFAVPASLGGRLRSFEELYHVVRALARRDVVVANVLGTTLLGSVFTWLAGTDDQRARLAAAVLGGGLAGLALTEEAHGADTAASEVEARPVPGGYELTGTKWLVNNGSRAWALAVLAAVPVDGGRELGLFLVERSALREGSYALLPKIRTLGVRGLDLCALRFDRCAIPASARTGSLGSGLDTLLRGLYVTRSLCAGFSLGAADTALRVTLRFARGRQLYGAAALDIPEVRARVAGAFADLLLADCVAVTAMRSIHVAPEQVSVASAVVKYWVPTTAEAAMRDLAVVLGARHYLREGEAAIFQKALRDGMVVSLFDGSTAVNQYVLGLQLQALARGRARPRAQDPRAGLLFDLDAPLPPFDAPRLAVVSGGRDLVLGGFAAVVAEVERRSPDDEAARTVAEHARALVAELERDDAASLNPRRTNRAADARTPERFEQAMRYAALHTAAASNPALAARPRAARRVLRRRRLARARARAPAAAPRPRRALGVPRAARGRRGGGAAPARRGAGVRRRPDGDRGRRGRGAMSNLRTLVAGLAPDEQRAWLSVLLRQRANAERGLSDLPAEAVLEPFIRPDRLPDTREPASPPRAVLLTGATGFVGAFLLAELLRATRADVHCLVRAASPAAGLARLLDALAHHQLAYPDAERRVVPVVGDLGKRLFGLAPPAFDALAARIDEVYHCGAVPNWLFPYDALRGPNVVGTREALRLCATHRRKPLHHLSTLGVVLSAGDFAAPVLREDVDLDDCARHPIGYTQSKWVAEKLVQEARARGLPASIHRPAFISGDSASGVYKTRGNFVFACLRAAVRLGVTHERDWLVSLTPVNVVARTLVALARRPGAAGLDYHYPDPAPVRWRALVGWLRDFGYRVDERPLDDWLAAIRRAGPEGNLFGFLPLLAPPSRGPSAYEVGYLRSQLVVDCANTERMLGDEAARGASVTAETFRRYLAYLVRTGLLPPPPGAGGH